MARRFRSGFWTTRRPSHSGDATLEELAPNDPPWTVRPTGPHSGIRHLWANLLPDSLSSSRTLSAADEVLERGRSAVQSFECSDRRWRLDCSRGFLSGGALRDLSSGHAPRLVAVLA